MHIQKHRLPARPIDDWTQAAIDCFTASLFDVICASDGKPVEWRDTKSRSKQDALEYRYVQPTVRWCSFIAVDIDRKDALLRLYDHETPPHLAIINRDNGHAHALWHLRKPIYIDDSNAPPIRYLRAVRRGLDRALGGDHSYSGTLVRNPAHPDWNTHCLRPIDLTYSLADLATHLDLSAATVVEKNSMGRNDTLFASLRRWGMANKAKYESDSLFGSDMRDQAEYLNEQFPIPLGQKEVDQIVRSVSRYIWKKWSGKARGIMNLDPTLPVEERQRMGQAYAAAKRADATKSKIITALTNLRGRGVRPTQAKVAEVSGISLRSVKSYWAEVKVHLEIAGTRALRPVNTEPDWASAHVSAHPVSRSNSVRPNRTLVHSARAHVDPHAVAHVYT